MGETIAGGYEPVTTGQLLNATRADALSTSALRAYLGLIAISATRNAFKRQTPKGRGYANRTDNFSISELTALIEGISERNIRRGLKELKDAGLATVTKSQISLNAFPTAETKELMEEAGVKQRAIPAPRRLLRFLAKSKRRSLIVTATAYMLRGLYLHKREIRNTGTAKVSWIAETFGISESSVKNARRELIELGFISPDATESQRKLNRTGAYFEINLAWNYQQETQENGGVEEEKCRVFTPPHAKKCRVSAPPYKKQVTPYRSLETNKPENRTSGFCKSKVSFKNIKPEDIQKISLLLMLYRSALEERVFEHSEINLLNFFSAAAKAKRNWKDPIKIFVWTVRNNFKFITETDEKQAERALKSYRRRNPEAFNFLDSQGSGRLKTASQHEQQAKIQGLISELLVAQNKLVA